MEKPSGHLHPITQVIYRAVKIFRELGFTVAEGPEVETEWYNFDALNIPADHPARDMWDTFWLQDGGERKVLRTHTSPVQVRYLEANPPPVRIIAPGRVFRFEATDATHEAQFYQLEMLLVDKEVTIAELKGLIEEFFKRFFGHQTRVRFRPSFFPFVEPGLEVDVSCSNCKGEDPACLVCKGTGWLEMGGAGLVHPSVLVNSRLDPSVWSGFAFGMGVDRLAMIHYGIPDVRLFYSGDERFLKQF